MSLQFPRLDFCQYHCQTIWNIKYEFDFHKDWSEWGFRGGRRARRQWTQVEGFAHAAQLLLLAIPPTTLSEWNEQRRHQMNKMVSLSAYTPNI